MNGPPVAHLILSCNLPLPPFPLQSKIVCRIRKSLTKWQPWESTYSRPSRASPFRLPTPPPPLTSMGSLAWFESASQCRSRFLWSCLWRSRRPTRRERVARRTAETRGGRGSEWRSMATRQLSLVLLLSGSGELRYNLSISLHLETLARNFYRACLIFGSLWLVDGLWMWILC